MLKYETVMSIDSRPAPGTPVPFVPPQEGSVGLSAGLRGADLSALEGAGYVHPPDVLANMEARADNEALRAWVNSRSTQLGNALTREEQQGRAAVLGAFEQGEPGAADLQRLAAGDVPEGADPAYTSAAAKGYLAEMAGGVATTRAKEVGSRALAFTIDPENSTFWGATPEPEDAQPHIPQPREPQG